MRALANDQRINGVRYSWKGASNASPSVQRVNGSVVREQLVNNPRFTDTSGTVEVRRNLFSNPRAVSLTSWGSYISTSYVRTVLGGISDHPLGITTANRVTATTSGTAIGGAYFGQNAKALPIVAATTYVISVYIRPSISLVISPTVEWKKSDDTPAGTDTIGPSVTCPAGVWTRVSVIGTSPANTAYANITFYNTSNSTMWFVGDTLDSTGAMVEKSTILRDFFDGSYSPDPDLSPVWVGTANDSQSYLRGFVPANTVNNNNSCVASSYGMRLIPNKSADNNSNTRVGGSSVSLSGHGVTFTPGKWYGVQAVHTLLAPQTGKLNNFARRMFIVYNNVSWWGGETYVQSIQPPNEAGSYKEELVTKLPADTIWAGLYVYNGASFGCGDVYWDKLLLVEGDTETEVRSKLANGYFDGDTQVDASTINGVKL